MTEKEKRFLQSEIRQKIVEALRTDLIGPRKGTDEVLDENPELSYLTGVLHPIDKKSSVEFDEQADIALDAADSDAMGEEDNEDKYAATFRQQSSFGLSFYLPENISSFTATLDWGDYVLDKLEYEDEKTGKTRTKRVFTRFQKSADIAIVLNPREKTSEYEAELGIRVKVTQYHLGNGYKLISLYAANYRHGTDETVDGIMFQCKLTVTTHDTFFIPEYLCRKHELSDEYLYESRPIIARGHGCAVDWETNADGSVSKVFSEFIPEHEIPGVSAVLDGFAEKTFSMRFMMQPKNKNETIRRLKSLYTAYANWIGRLSGDPKMSRHGFAAQGKDVLDKCNTQADRILSGIKILEENETAFKAFCFMNQCMFMQRSISSFSKKYGSGVKCNLAEFLSEDHSEWRAFQIAFILLNLSGIIDYKDRFRKYVDLLYFPTGGGKTEAYLGLMAFLMGFRRLSDEILGDYIKDGGVTIILRYTLRLLTTQQRDRLTKMIVAAEIVRREYLTHGAPYGHEPFSIGFYVGGGVTPNSFSEFTDTPEDPYRGYKTKKKMCRQLLTCPYCGKPLNHDDFIVDPDQESVEIYCADKHCFFYKYNNNRVAIPIYLVDEQIYRKCPTIVIATVDKFARLPWDPACNALFGRIDRHCPRHGYIAIGKEHESRHSFKDKLPATTTQTRKPFFPPELIVQDELHLITGSLGTIYGGYEAAIEELCSAVVDGEKVLPKYVVSTATIKNAEAQVRCLYGRRNTLQFPSDGLDIKDSFFTKEIPVSESPFREYCGICASGKSLKTTQLRVYAILLQVTHALAENPKYKDFVDPYHTLIGYFNSIRELGGTVRLLQDDIPKRIKWIKKHYGHSSQRFYKHREITSRMNAEQIAKLLKILELKRGETAILGTEGRTEKVECLDVAIATNMISVGLDIDRLGLMCVYGQPKQSSEYIQTTSRIGRSHPGLVVTIYNPYRPRDLSHYENFKGFHNHIYRFVEGTTATPFSARARDRVLHALFVSLARLQIEELAENGAAANISKVSAAKIDAIVNKIAARVSLVAPKLQPDVIRELTEFIDEWKMLNRLSALPLCYYFRDVTKKERLLNYYGEHCRAKEKPTLSSMREVENTATLYYWEET